MFSTARCFVPAHPQPRVTVPCRRAPALTAVSARPRRDRSWDDCGSGSGDEEGAGDRIDESFFGEARGEEEPEPEEEEEEQPGRRAALPAPEPARQLRGSDVLRALQRATAAKEAEKKKKSAGVRPAARRQEKGGGVKPVEVVGEARPIEIRREWAPRIRELELRVKQLVDMYHHHQ